MRRGKITPNSKFSHRNADNAGSHVVKHKCLTTSSLTGPTLSGSHVDKPTSSITGKLKTAGSHGVKHKCLTTKFLTGAYTPEAMR